MRIIEKILGINNTNDYYFAEYSIRGVGRISLLLKKDKNLFYDFENHIYVDSFEINFKEKLTDYESINKEKLSKVEAKQYAKKHYQEFHDKFIKYYTYDKDVFEEDGCFYVVI